MSECRVTEDLTQQIEQAMANGWSATRAAREYVQRGGNGSLSQAETVFRTEINRANGEAYMADGERTPGFGGWRYLLSPVHPRPDICDLLSTQNLYGLGPGVYPDRTRTPWPAHPNTLSFVEIVFADEITEADRVGKETSLQALARLTPEQRVGVLGKTEAGYFDRGLLRAWMIRSKPSVVTIRLKRQGLLLDLSTNCRDLGT